MHEFGVKSPHLFEEAMQIDKETNANFWKEAVAKEIEVAWKAVARNDDHSIDKARKGNALIEHQEMTGHLTFDTKMDGKITQKSQTCCRWS